MMHVETGNFREREDTPSHHDTTIKYWSKIGHMQSAATRMLGDFDIHVYMYRAKASNVDYLITINQKHSRLLVKV